MNLEVIWTPPTAAASEPILKAFDASGEGMRKTCAYHRTADGRRYYQIPDSDENRNLVRELGPGWALKEDLPKESTNQEEPEKKALVLAELTRLGIPHRENFKLETLVKKLPIEMREAFL